MLIPFEFGHDDTMPGRWGDDGFTDSLNLRLIFLRLKIITNRVRSHDWKIAYNTRISQLRNDLMSNYRDYNNTSVYYASTR